MPTPSVDLHDAVLEMMSVNWTLGICVLHLRLVSEGPASMATVTWQGITSIALTRDEPWGPSDSVLGLESGPDGTWTLELQSGDTLSVTASRISVQREDALASRYAGLIVDELVSAALLRQLDVERATALVETEIRVRRAMGDA